ncbi:MAG: TVP38/TMEM64 family protein [Ruminococcaceae bacterium]|nr:TVP38/TMEM64 family protein [Oscillospiraceae bacterium]
MGKRKERAKALFRDKKLEQTKTYSKKVSIVTLISFALLSLILAALGVVFIKNNFTDVDNLKRFVEENYILSALALIIICALQVIIALIPGELVEIAAGYAFGAIEGSLICLTGITLGSILVILLTRKIGRRFIESLCPREKLDSLPILSDPRKRNFATALLFLIPGTPKDLITYVIGITEMSIPLYVLISTIARLPSIIISAIGGDALGNKKFIFAIVAFLISGAVSLAGYIVYKLVIEKREKKPSTSQKKDVREN